MRFTIWVLVAGAFFSLIALLLSELLPRELQQNAIVHFLRMQDPFRSWWFRLLLGVLGISLFICIFDRAPVLIKQAFTRSFRTRISQFDGHFDTHHVSCHDGEQNALTVMKRLGLSVRRQKTKDGIAFSGVSGRLSRLGPLLNHSGMLLLIIGGFVIGLTGGSTRIIGSSGDIINEPDWEFTLRIDDFEIIYYPVSLNQLVLTSDGSRGNVIDIEGDSAEVAFTAHKKKTLTRWFPVDSLKNDFLMFNGRKSSPYQGNIKSYITRATVLVDDTPVLSKAIKVNHPLRFRGRRFYQSSFDLHDINTDVDSVVIRYRQSDQIDTVITLAVGSTPVDLGWNGLKVAAERFLPDFRLDRNMKAFTASGHLHNPAVRINVLNSENEFNGIWVFPHEMGGMGHSRSDLSMQLLDVRGVQTEPGGYITILDVNYTSGNWLIWAGFLVITLGLLLAYSKSYISVWALIKKDDNGLDEMFILGRSSRDDSSFKERLSRETERIAD